MDNAKIVSVFDGMGCGMLAMIEAGVKVGRYVANEIDKYAVQTSSHNFPEIEHRGDVFQADFREFEGFDWLVGGSPCTYWSIAQKNGRETEASGLGWELFCQYVRALREVKPRFFIYENNKSMAKAIRQSITETFGFEPICINSALVSAQNRQRLYWVGRRNEDGSYSKVDVQQPEDRKVYMEQILKADDFAVYKGGRFVRRKEDLEKYTDKSYQLGATGASGGQAVRVYDLKGKSVTIKSQAGGVGPKPGYTCLVGKSNRFPGQAWQKCKRYPSGIISPVATKWRSASWATAGRSV